MQKSIERLTFGHTLAVLLTCNVSYYITTFSNFLVSQWLYTLKNQSGPQRTLFIYRLYLSTIMILEIRV